MKIGILTITWGTNYGNRLQNYAVQEVLKSLGHDVYTIHRKYDIQYDTKYWIKKILVSMYLTQNLKQNSKLNLWSREIKFDKFNRSNIKFIKNNRTSLESLNNFFDKIICGSDQIWNPYYLGYDDDAFLRFCDENKRIAYCPSIGVEEIPLDRQYRFIKYINKFHALSIRENQGADIISKLTGKHVEVLIDPTLMLTDKKWRNISKKPKIKIEKKYVLTYFLGNIENKKRRFIEDIAKNDNLEIINLPVIEYTSRWHTIDPAEFLWLIDNANYICTDSFHATIFSILFKKNYVVFDREGEKISSRIDTLLDLFDMEDCKYSGNGYKIKNVNHNIEKVLYRERKKTLEYLEKSIKV